ncbi:hypothetical protein ONZ45_g4705 [Pleurotus djamor]|nr:hypothetical protein ONZ45_g4705 [Pleurotus djamor]
MNNFVFVALLPSYLAFLVAATPFNASALPSSEIFNGTSTIVNATEFPGFPNATLVPSNASSIDLPPVTEFPCALPSSVGYNSSVDANSTFIYTSAYPGPSEIPGNVSSIIIPPANETGFPSSVFGSASSVGVYPSSNGSFPSLCGVPSAYPTSNETFPSGVYNGSFPTGVFNGSSVYGVPVSTFNSSFPTASANESEIGFPSSIGEFPSSVYDLPGSSVFGGYPTGSVNISAEIPVSTA